MARLDPHSYADLTQGKVHALKLELRVDFAARTLQGEATLLLESPSKGGPLDLDSRSLQISAIYALASDLELVDPTLATSPGAGQLPFQIVPASADQAWMGERLCVQLPKGARGFTVRYQTSPSASALQWLEPKQTKGGKHPFLFSQCQAIHARSVVPLQDTPRARLTYEAALHVPRRLNSRMAAKSLGRQASRFGNDHACDSYAMPQAIPPYLFALAVGELAEAKLNERSSVIAEPSQLAAAAHEFEAIPTMLEAAEKLFGPYAWDRFDVLVMPPSFPYGGMENPRLTFLTPSVIAGDKSLVNVVAHELAHAWTGNLVTNSDGNHFWLNEGFTVYAERRILEALEGRDASELHAAIGRHELDEALGHFAKTPALTKLRTDLTGIDPDEAYSQIPYEKGYFFLRAVEESEGRAAFDRFLRAWITCHSFESVTTDAFLALIRAELPGIDARVPLLAWIDEPGLPANAPQPKSPRWFELKASAQHASEKLPSIDAAAKFTPAELLLFLQSLPANVDAKTCAAIDALFGLREKQSFELRCAFLVAALRAGLPDAPERAKDVLLSIGRMKFLRPLYKGLAARAETKAFAQQLFAEASPRYHPIARAVIAPLLA